MKIDNILYIEIDLMGWTVTKVIFDLPLPVVYDETKQLYFGKKLKNKLDCNKWYIILTHNFLLLGKYNKFHTYD